MLATPYPQQPGAIVIKLNKAGTDKMIAWTKDMASQKDRIAMVLDGVVINAPVVYKVPLRDNFIIEELCEPGEVNCLIAALMNPYEMPVVIDDKKTAIMNKLRSIVIPRIDLEDVSLEEAVHFFRLRAAELDIKELDPTLKGINIVIRQTRPGVDGKGGHEFGRINLKLENIPLAKAFAAVAEHTGAVFTVDDFAVAVQGESKTDELKAPSFPELAAEFYSNVSAPGRLALSINDQATLEIAKEKLEKCQKRITQLAKEWRKLPVPDSATKHAVNKSIEEKEEKMTKEIGEALKKHFKEMPAELAKQWAPALQAFYQSLDQNKEVFSRYFGETEIKKKS